jgi:hypothetical protein
MKWIEVAQRYMYLDYLTGSPQTDISDEARVHPGEVNNEDILLTLPEKQYMLELAIKKRW